MVGGDVGVIMARLDEERTTRMRKWAARFKDPASKRRVVRFLLICLIIGDVILALWIWLLWS